MINDLVGGGSEKASQRGWLFVRTVTKWKETWALYTLEK